MRNAKGLQGEHVTYNRKNDVIWVDATGARAETKRDLDEIFDPIVAAARAYPDRYVIACWKDAKIADAEAAAYYGKRSADLLALCRGIVRYAANDPLTRAYIRTEAIKHRTEGSRTNLYASDGEALAAVLEMRRRGAPPSSGTRGR